MEFKIIISVGNPGPKLHTFSYVFLRLQSNCM